MELKGILLDALSELYETDADLIANEANEDTLNGRLACYLRPNLEFENIKVDIEYNRHIDNVKYYSNEGKYAVVDIVVHQRMTDENNMLAIECKRGKLIESDINKIQALCRSEFGYNLGATISYYQKEITFYEWDVENEGFVTEIIKL
jgi:hypothetical protein